MTPDATRESSSGAASTSYLDILKHGAIYGVGQILSRLASFLLLPLYTEYLRPADYGRIAILDLTATVLAIAIGCGMSTAVNCFHIEAENEGDRDRVWWTGLTFVTVFATAVLLPLWFARESLAALTLGRGETSGGYYFGFVLPTLWAGIAIELLLSSLRVMKRSTLIVGLNMGRMIFNIAANVYFLVVLGMGVVGILLGNLITVLVMLAVLFAVFARSRGAYAFDRRLLQQLAAFGAPLIPVALLSMWMHAGDRYLLRLFTDLADVGVYSVARTIGQAVNSLLLIPFSAIWGVLIFEIGRKPDSDRVFGTIFEYYVYAVLLVMLGVSIAADPLLALMAASDYGGASTIIPIVCLAYVFFGLNAHFEVPVLLAKRTMQMVPAAALAVVVNVAGNVLAVPRFGSPAAAWVAVLTFATYSFAGLLRYRRFARYPYPFLRCGAVLCGMVATYVVVTFVLGPAVDRWTSLAVATCAWLVWAIILLGPPLRHLLALVRSRRGSLRDRDTTATPAG